MQSEWTEEDLALLREVVHSRTSKEGGMRGDDKELVKEITTYFPGSLIIRHPCSHICSRYTTSTPSGLSNIASCICDNIP